MSKPLTTRNHDVAAARKSRNPLPLPLSTSRANLSDMAPTTSQPVPLSPVGELIQQQQMLLADLNMAASMLIEAVRPVLSYDPRDQHGVNGSTDSEAAASPLESTFEALNTQLRSLLQQLHATRDAVRL